MINQKNLVVVPAYHAAINDKSVPFIVSLLLIDNGKIVIPPVVEKSIDKVIDITGRDGLCNIILTTEQNSLSRVKPLLKKAINIKGIIILFQCQTPELCEQLMVYLNEHYVLSLVTE